MEGDLGGRVYLIERGWVVLSCVAAGGRETVLAIRGPGDILGEMSAFDGTERSAGAHATGDVETIVAASSVVDRALSDVNVAHELIGLLAARLRDADHKRIEFATLNTVGRVACRLLELAERFGEETADGVAVELPLSQEQLASWCGASREATVKGLAALRGLKIIATGRRTVLIRDRAALQRHAQMLI
jgi:CRP-like cAMP-binding protein